MLHLYRPAARQTFNMTNNNNAPSGIAQLRKTSDLSLGQQVDPMNLDDFIFPENAPSATLSAPAQSADLRQRQQMQQQQHRKDGVASGNPQATAIPIKSLKHASSQPLIPQSVPAAHQRHQDEFGYVTRHHRKTSIDDRRVSKVIFSFLKSVVNFNTFYCMFNAHVYK